MGSRVIAGLFFLLKVFILKFLDYTEIFVRSGDGGDGLVSFKSGKYQPKLGPDGGDGGFGGDVYAITDAQLNTLSSLRYRQMYKAEDGQKGGTNNKTGRNGEDCFIPMPLGTVITDLKTGAVFGELLEEGQRILIVKGGIRGLGNLRYLSSTHQAPMENKNGGKGEEIELSLELKLMADVGLAGFPNAGKSTLLSVLSNAKPKIADYPFTTLTPQLGVVDVYDITGDWGQSIVMADIPGLIEGASEGRGLGHEFLKHLERTKILLFLVDGFASELEPLDQYLKLAQELSNYSESLAEKPRLVVINKIDLVDADEIKLVKEKLVEVFRDINQDVLFISGATKTGLMDLKRKLLETLSEMKSV